jgi:predicted Fe-Mo cluster-binding NifX family protein
MMILLPMNGNDTQESELVSINEATQWAVVEFDAGEVVEIKFYPTRESVEAWVEVVVVISDFEPVTSFMEEQIMVLVAHTQRTIDEVIEAYMFRELNELAV